MCGCCAAGLVLGGRAYEDVAGRPLWFVVEVVFRFVLALVLLGAALRVNQLPL